MRTLSGVAGSSVSGSRSNGTPTRASTSSIALSPKTKTKVKSAETPAIDQPSLTWGIMPHSADGKKKVIEYLEKEGIDTSELYDVELPNTIEVMQERLDFLKKLGLSLETINSYPLMVTCSIKKNLIPVLDYLEQLGLRSRDLPSFIENYPMVLHSSVVIDLMPVVDYLLGLDIQRKDVIKVLARYPDVLGFRLEGTMSTSVAYLVSLGVRTRCIGRMLTEYPEILGMRVAKSIKPKVDFFLSFGIPKAVVAKLLEVRPYMLGFDLTGTMEAAVDDLLEAGVRKEGIPSIITQYPDILGQGIRGNLIRKTEWLVHRVKVEPENVPVIIEKLPQILFIKEELAMERVWFFRNAGCSAEEVAKMVTECPQILALSIAQVIEPSLNFLMHNMKRSVKEVVEFPAYFTYDLKSRIMPRHTMIAEKGVDCSLEWFLNCTDQRFRVRLSAEYLDDDNGPGPIFQMGGIIHTELKPVEEENTLEEDFDSEETKQQQGKREQPRSSLLAQSRESKMRQQQRDNILESASDMYSEDEGTDEDTDDARAILQTRRREETRSSLPARRRVTKLRPQQRENILESALGMYSENEDTDDDTDDARAILQARVQDDDDLEGLESASEFGISEEEEDDDDDELSDNDDNEVWDMPGRVIKSVDDDDDDDDDWDDETEEEEVQQRATNRRNR